MNGKTKKYDWIDDLVIKRKSLFSNGILVESADPKRIEELVNRKPTVMTNAEKWFILDAWEGFCSIDKNAGGDIMKKQEKGGDVQQLGVRQVLPVVSKQLEKRDTVLLVTNVFKTDDYINNALRGWSTSETLMDYDSTIIVFADDKCIYPSSVWTHMSIIHPPRSTWDERKAMIEFQQHEFKKDIKKADYLSGGELNDAIRLTAGMNLNQLEASVIESILSKRCIDLTSIGKSKLSIFAEDHVVDVIDQPRFGFEVVGGYATLKQTIIDSVVLPLKNPDMASRYDMQPPRGLLLFGPPGTGKTLLIKSMAKELNMSILRIKPENILGKYVGESEKSLRRAFDIADSMVPCIVFIDELDRFSKREAGDNVSSHVERELFSMLLEKLGDEERQWFFAGATNIVESIDSAMRRTGRIDSVIPMPFPDVHAREEIFHIHTCVKRHLPLGGDVDAHRIAVLTEMWSGSDIEQFVIRTARFVMKKDILKPDVKLDIMMDDFMEIHKTFNIDKDANVGLQNSIREQAVHLANDKRMMDIFDSSAEKTVGFGRSKKAKELL